MTRIAFTQARHFRIASRSHIDLVVLHSAEIAESASGAEALMRRFAETDRKASCHYIVDSNSVCQSVREKDIAFHAPGANHNSVGIELCGRARQTPEEWADPYSTSMLTLAAELVSHICLAWAIPVVFVEAGGLQAGKRGVTTHAAVTAAFGKSTHTDPGPHFPVTAFLAAVADHIQRLPL